MVFSFVKKLFSNGSGATKSSVSTISNQYIFSSGTQNLGSNLTDIATFPIPNFRNMNLSSLKFVLTMNGTAGATAPTSMNPIEYGVKKLQIATAGGVILMDLDGSKNDISIMARYLTLGGKYTASTTPATPSASGNTSGVWNLSFPFGIPASFFPLTLTMTFNTLSSLTGGSTPLASATLNMNMYASYTTAGMSATKIKSLDIPVASSGDIALQSNFPQGRTIITLVYQYGADANLDSVYFAPDGLTPELNNAPLSSLVDKEDIVYPVAQHIDGFINLFTDVFSVNPSTSFSINFTNAPSLLNGTANKLRTYWIEAY